MLHTIHDFPNPMLKEINKDFLLSTNDIPIEDLVVMVMKEYEAIANIEITGYDIITDPDKIDINEHSININYKRRKASIEIPRNKYLATNRVGEIRFYIKLTTNKETTNIVKKILIPIEYEGFYAINNKKWKTLWQLVDASTYSQKGKITLKSRMPIIIYKSKKRLYTDMSGEIVEYSSYSYAMNGKPRYGGKAKVKFINPLMIFAAKIGIYKTIDYFNLGHAMEFVDAETEPDWDWETYRYFQIDDLVLRVNRYLVDTIPFIGSFVAMMMGLASQDYRVTKEVAEDTYYWRCRIGAIGNISRTKSLSTFYEKGNTSIYMVERLLDSISRMDLRLPEPYKKDIYAILRWMILDFDQLKNRNNMDLNNKRIRKNEYIVLSSLGKKISENINKLIEKKSKSKLNTMDTLLELFNFGSDIIVAGMRNIGDLIKADELVNDMTMLQDLYFSAKGPNSLGEQSSKIISQKYRNIHPSYVGRIDINVSSNSDVGMSGAFTPFLQLYDRFYFSPEHEPCSAGMHIQKEIAEYYNSPACQALGFPVEITFDSIDDYMKYVAEHDEQFPGLKYEEIRIVEKLDAAPSYFGRRAKPIEPPAPEPPKEEPADESDAEPESETDSEEVEEEPETTEPESNEEA